MDTGTSGSGQIELEEKAFVGGTMWLHAEEVTQGACGVVVTLSCAPQAPGVGAVGHVPLSA